jgi:hypothetical protein
MFDVYREEKDQLVSVFSKEGDLIVSMAPLSGNAGNSKINTLGHHSPREYWLKPPIS